MSQYIQQLYTHNFRNLTNSLLKFSPGINIFVGNNAQGKTNILEALYYSLHAKSFKHTKLQDIITNNNDSLATQVLVNNSVVDIYKTLTNSTVTLNKESVGALQISELVPMQVISPDKGFIVGGSNTIKRSTLNWGVFHVEQSFKSLFSQYSKIHKNINILIKNNKSDELKIWLQSLAKYTHLINVERNTYLEALQRLPIIQSFIKEDIDPSLFTFSFQTGIPKYVHNNEEEIHDFFLKNIKFIINNKYLRYGPHTASLTFEYDGIAEHNLSRGQQKTLSVLFWLIQLSHLIECGKHPVVLLDDISSELDSSKTPLILNFLQERNIQSFITSITSLEGEYQTYFVNSGKVEYN